MKFILNLLLGFALSTAQAAQFIPDASVGVRKLYSDAFESNAVTNCSLAASVGSSALTISLKDGAGNTPSAASPCKISFRNATATTGTYSTVAATAATTLVVSNGSAIGCVATVSCTLYVYAINNAGTVVLGVVSGASFDPGTVQSSTAEGGAGAADTLGTMYSTAAQSSKAVRLIGRVVVTPAASFAWTASPTEISNVPFASPSLSNWASFTPTGAWSANSTYTGKYRRVGDSAEIYIGIALAGAPTSATLSINLPSGLVIDTAKMVSSSAGALLPDSVVRIVAAATGYIGYVQYNTTTSVIVASLQGAASTNNYVQVTQAIPGTFANGDLVQISFKVPIVGWGI